MPALEPKAERSAGDRFAWLDVARAVAVSAVALMHCFDEAVPAWRRFNTQFFNPGVFGVVLFFLVSGFVIPLSLERRGSIRVFVTSRLFRLYPLYWASLIAVTVLHAVGWAVPPLDFTSPGRLPQNFLWNVTMLQHWVGVPDAIGLYWSLAYELVFYAATVVFFVLGVNRRTDVIVGLGAAYFLLRGALLPLVSGVGHFNPEEFWLLTFFVGTLWYRGWNGEFSIRRVTLVTALFVASVVANHVTTYGVLGQWDRAVQIQPRAAGSAWAAAYATFGLLLWLRRVSWPKALTWLGRVSYSVYLIHGALIMISSPLTPFAALAVQLVVLLPLCAVTYRYIELPMIAIGHRLSNPGRRPVENAGADRESSGRAALGALLASAVISLGIGLVDQHLQRARLKERHTIDFDDASTPRSALVAGWSDFEDGGPDAASVAWCAARDCILSVSVPDARDHVLRIHLAPFQYAGAPEQRLTVSLNENSLGTEIVTPGWTTLSFKAGREVWRAGSNQVRLHFAYAESPKGRVPGSDDVRTLAATFDWIAVEPDA